MLQVKLNLLILLLVFSINCFADDMKINEMSLADEVTQLKKQVIDLNRELFLLEEDLLFPGNTQFAVFLSLDIGKYFSLDSVELKIDDKEVTHYLYTKKEINALSRGATQRLYLGNLKSGEHEIVAYFIGKGPKGRSYKRGSVTKFEKGLGPKYVELKIVDDTKDKQPDFTVREWE